MNSDLKKIYIRLNALNDSLLPNATDKYAAIRDGSWDLFNASLQTLTQLTNDSYFTSLKISPVTHGATPLVRVSDYSSKVYQAVSYLYETEQDTGLSDVYPPQKPKVGDGNSISQTSVLSQGQDSNQSQVTEVQVSVNIEFNQTLTYMTESIVEARSRYKEGTKERTFLDKLKDGISTAKTTADLIKMIMTAAVQFGITTEVLGEIFK